MDIFGVVLTCFGVPSYALACFVVLLYRQWLAWSLAFIYIVLIGCPPLSLCERLHLHGLVVLFVLMNIGLFGRSPISTLPSLVVWLYLQGLVWVFAFTYTALFGCVTKYITLPVYAPCMHAHIYACTLIHEHANGYSLVTEIN